MSTRGARRAPRVVADPASGGASASVKGVQLGECGTRLTVNSSSRRISGSNMSPVPQGGQEVSDGQEEREEEARAVREMKEEMQQRTEECGAVGEEQGVRGTGRGSAVARRPGVLVVAPRGLTAEEKKKNDLEKAAACRNRTVLDRQHRERAAVGLEAAKRARLGGEEHDGGARRGVDRREPYVYGGSGRVKQVLPGPPGVYTLYSTRAEAVGSAAVEQLVDQRREVQEAMDQEGAEDRAAAGRMREAQQAEISAQQEGGGAAGEEVMDGRHVGGLEQTAGEVRRQGGLLPPPRH